MRTYMQEEKQAVIDRVISGELSAHILADTGIPTKRHPEWDAKSCEIDIIGSFLYEFERLYENDASTSSIGCISLRSK